MHSEEEIDWYTMIILFLKNIFYWKIYISLYIIQEVVLPGISKRNESAIDEEQGDQTQFSSKKDSRKRNMYLRSIIFAMIPVDGECYRLIDPSTLHIFFFICLKMFIM